MAIKSSVELSIDRIRAHLDPRHVLLDYCYTILLSLVIAAFLRLAGIAAPFLVNLIMALSYGLTICTLIGVLFWVLNPSVVDRLSMSFTMIAGVVGGMLIGSQIGHFVLRRLFALSVGTGEGDFFKNAVTAVFFGGAATYFFYAKGRLKLVGRQAEEERMNRLAMEKEALASKLRMLPFRQR